jgi:ribosomal protein L21
MYAIVKTGGKQYRVADGDIVAVEKIEGPVGTELALRPCCWSTATTSSPTPRRWRRRRSP